MRSGSYIQALGRQSFEPSQPAAPLASGAPRPSELSHTLQRQLMKAQNDVLATVGVCLRESKQSADVTDSLYAEQLAGVALSVLGLTATYVATWPLVGLRNRLQTFRAHERRRYRDVLAAEWRRNAPAHWYAGLPAHLCFQLAGLAREYAQACLLNWLQRRACFVGAAGQRRRVLWLHAIDKR